MERDSIMVCTRCSGTGFINLDQIDPEIYGMDVPDLTSEESILKWINSHIGHEVSVCDCCGDGLYWYDVPGEHYISDDPCMNFFCKSK